MLLRHSFRGHHKWGVPPSRKPCMCWGPGTRGSLVCNWAGTCRVCDRASGSEIKSGSEDLIFAGALNGRRVSCARAPSQTGVVLRTMWGAPPQPQDGKMQDLPARATTMGFEHYQTYRRRKRKRHTKRGGASRRSTTALRWVVLCTFALTGHYLGPTHTTQRL